MKRNGQALVEFIIVLPILIIILLGIVDFGFIFYEKNVLESNLEEVTNIWKDKKSEEELVNYLNNIDDEIELNVILDDETTTIELIHNYDVLTPGVNLILKNPFEIKVSRVIYNE